MFELCHGMVNLGWSIHVRVRMLAAVNTTNSMLHYFNGR